MSKHAPHPFRAESDGRPEMGENFYILDAEGRTVAFCTTGWDEDVGAANAAVLAAGPELLAEIESMAEDFRCFLAEDKTPDGGWLRETVVALAALVKKGRGEGR